MHNKKSLHVIYFVYYSILIYNVLYIKIQTTGNNKPQGKEDKG